jgi:hypothetical protein
VDLRRYGSRYGSIQTREGEQSIVERADARLDAVRDHEQRVRVKD